MSRGLCLYPSSRLENLDKTWTWEILNWVKEPTVTREVCPWLLLSSKYELNPWPAFVAYMGCATTCLMRLLHMRIEVAPLALRAPRSSAHAIAHTYLLREAVSVSPNPCQTVYGLSGSYGWSNAALRPWWAVWCPSRRAGCGWGWVSARTADSIALRQVPTL